MKKLTRDEIINRFRTVHGDKYDYSLVDYINSHTKVKIICHEHDIYEQTPYNHIGLKQGCPNCYGNKKLTKDEFIRKSKNIHGDKYDYNLVEYKNNFTKVKIICPIHGIFEQKPNLHIIQKSGCLKCSGKNLKTNDDFVSLSRKVHGDEYDYSLVNYKNGKTKVKIICHKHDVFEQTPDLHTNRKHGCPICKSSFGEKLIEKTLKENNIKYTKEYTFEDCRYRLPLRFDFYLSELKICIEYDGLQHYEVINFWGGIEHLNLVQKRDQLKNEYCEKKNIRLIRIKYDRNLKSEYILKRIHRP